MLHTILMLIHFACAIGIVGLVLLQRGRGADAGAGFGAGASGTVFGARGATTALSRATAVLAAIFMVTSLSLAYLGTKSSVATGGGSLLDRMATEPAKGAAAPATTTAPAPAAPGGTSGTAPAGSGQ